MMQSLWGNIARFRKTLYINLDPLAWPRAGMSWLNIIISILVVACVLSVVLETEPVLATEYGALFKILNHIFLYAFTVEYLVRVWVMTESEQYKGWSGRIRYMRTPMALVDLACVLPIWLGLGSWLLFFRIARLWKLTRIPIIHRALQNLSRALFSRIVELCLSVVIAFLLMLVAAITLYVIEGDAQPDVFGSIPRALWWGVATLTTVGYGDVYPVTPLGKVCAGVFAIAGIGLVAMPTGIFAAAMSEIMAKPSDEDVDR